MATFSTVRRIVYGAALAAWSALTAWPATAAAAQVSELPSAFIIAKSSNKNQVHYALRIDETCAPAGPSPVRPYWRMLERGPFATEPLLESEQRVLGIDHQDVAGDSVQISLRGMPGRPITIHTWRVPEGRCAASAQMTIAGTAARVERVYVQQKFFGIDYVLLRGWSEDGSMVNERLLPRGGAILG